MDRFASLTPNLERQASNSECRRLLEEAVEKLPESYRVVFMLRDIEEMSTSDSADVLGITEYNVEVNLHRARALVRKSLFVLAGIEAKEAFTCSGVMCDEVVEAVFKRVQKQVSTTKNPKATIQ